MSKAITPTERTRWRKLKNAPTKGAHGVILRLLDALDAADKVAEEIPHLAYAMKRAALHKCANNPEFFEEEERHCEKVLDEYREHVGAVAE